MVEMSKEGKKDSSFVFTKENFRNPSLPAGLRVVEVQMRKKTMLDVWSEKDFVCEEVLNILRTDFGGTFWWGNYIFCI